MVQIVEEVQRMHTLGGGWTEQTPLKIVGLNNYRRLQGVPTWDAFRGAGKEVLRQVDAKLLSTATQRCGKLPHPVTT